jgi:hypothetical protein
MHKLRCGRRAGADIDPLTLVPGCLHQQLCSNANKASSVLKGPAHMIDYLGKLGAEHWRLITHYAEPLARSNDDVLNV